MCFSGAATVGQRHVLVGALVVAAFIRRVGDAGARLHDGASSAWWLVI